MPDADERFLQARRDNRFAIGLSQMPKTEDGRYPPAIVIGDSESGTELLRVPCADAAEVLLAAFPPQKAPAKDHLECPLPRAEGNPGKPHQPTDHPRPWYITWSVGNGPAYEMNNPALDVLLRAWDSMDCAAAGITVAQPSRMTAAAEKLDAARRAMRDAVHKPALSLLPKRPAPAAPVPATDRGSIPEAVCHARGRRRPA